MGTASFSVGSSGINKNVLASNVTTSGAFTTLTTATNLEDASGDISLSARDIIMIHADEAMRVRFGGVAATASTGHYIPAGEQVAFDVMEPRFVSIIDVA
jgi:hypothetical protein